MGSFNAAASGAATPFGDVASQLRADCHVQKLELTTAQLETIAKNRAAAIDRRQRWLAAETVIASASSADSAPPAPDDVPTAVPVRSRTPPVRRQRQLAVCMTASPLPLHARVSLESRSTEKPEHSKP